MYKKLYLPNQFPENGDEFTEFLVFNSRTFMSCVVAINILLADTFSVLNFIIIFRPRIFMYYYMLRQVVQIIHCYKKYNMNIQEWRNP